MLKDIIAKLQKLFSDNQKMFDMLQNTILTSHAQLLRSDIEYIPVAKEAAKSIIQNTKYKVPTGPICGHGDHVDQTGLPAEILIKLFTGSQLEHFENMLKNYLSQESIRSFKFFISELHETLLTPELLGSRLIGIQKEGLVIKFTATKQADWASIYFLCKTKEFYTDLFYHRDSLLIIKRSSGPQDTGVFKGGNGEIALAFRSKESRDVMSEFLTCPSIDLKTYGKPQTLYTSLNFDDYDTIVSISGYEPDQELFS